MRQHGVGVAVVCLAVVVLLGSAGLLAAETQIKAGSYVLVIRTADIRHGNQVVATVGKGTRLYVEDVLGNSVYVTVKDKGKSVRGSISRADVVSALPLQGDTTKETKPFEKPEPAPSAADADALAKIDKVPVEFLAVYAGIVPELKAKGTQVTFLVPLEGDLPKSDLSVGKGDDAAQLYRPDRQFSGRDFVQIPAPPSKELAAKIRSLLAAKRVDPKRLETWQNAGLLIGERGGTDERAKYEAARLAAPLWQKAYQAVKAAPTSLRQF